jgi:hypothetical protein
MAQAQPLGSGSAVRWGPLFGAHAQDWAETSEGPAGWGSPVYRAVITSDQPLTAPMVKPVINRSRNRLNTNAMGNATSTVAA